MSLRHSLIVGTAAALIAAGAPGLANADDTATKDADQGAPAMKVEDDTARMPEKSTDATVIIDLESRTGFLGAQSKSEVRAEQLIGAAVTRGDENIGTITDLVVGDDMTVTAYVVSVGGFLGIGDKHVAITSERVTVSVDENGDRVVNVPYTREQLEAAPAFVARDGTRMDIDETAELPKTE